MHGMIDSADAFIMNYPEIAPAFFLAKEGYDVWLGNTRGNKYCLKHEKYETQSAEFWSFSFEEQALQDLPANFEHIRSKTGF